MSLADSDHLAHTTMSEGPPKSQSCSAQDATCSNAASASSENLTPRYLGNDISGLPSISNIATSNQTADSCGHLDGEPSYTFSNSHREVFRRGTPRIGSPSPPRLSSFTDEPSATPNLSTVPHLAENVRDYIRSSHVWPPSTPNTTPARGESYELPEDERLPQWSLTVDQGNITTEDKSHEENLSCSETELESCGGWSSDNTECDVIPGEWLSDSMQESPLSMAAALALLKKALVEQIMTEFWVFFDRKWTAQVTTCTGNTGSGSSTSRHVKGSASRLTFTSNGPKRSRDDQDDLSSDGNDESPGRSNSNAKSPKSPEDDLKLACPFRKHNPQKYSLHNFPVCALSPWDTIARLKEHLYRVHKVPIYCKRCWLQFKTAEALDSHLTVPENEICKLQEGQAPEGITPEIALKLKSRKKASPRQSESERWKDIYRLLFPDELVPLPYFETVPDNAKSSPHPPESLTFEEFSRQHLPHAFRAYLDNSVNDKLRSLDDYFKSELVGIIRECQAQLARDYQSIIAGASVSSPSTIMPRSVFTDQSSPLDAKQPANGELTEPFAKMPRESSESNYPPTLPYNRSRADSKGEGVPTTSTPVSQSVFNGTLPSEPPFSDPSLVTCCCPGQCTCPPDITSTSFTHGMNLEALDTSRDRTADNANAFGGGVVPSDLNWFDDADEKDIYTNNYTW